MNLILDLFFPKRCIGCGDTGSYFCMVCIGNIRQLDLVCPKCGRLAVGGQTHPICQRRFGLDGLWSLGIYQDPLRQAIQTLKYKRVKEIALNLVDLTIEYWARYGSFLLDQIKKDAGEDWVVVPVPLYWFRENDRGFNQASLIGELLAQKLGLVYKDALKRVRYTKSQVKLKGLERHQNIRNAFAINSKLLTSLDVSRSGSIVNSKLILIDDVWTTGSTMKECAYILKRAGAKKVWGLTLAR